MDSIKSFTNVSAEVITGVKCFVSVLGVNSMIRATDEAFGVTNLGEMLRRRLAEARTHPAEEHTSGPWLGAGSDGAGGFSEGGFSGGCPSSDVIRNSTTKKRSNTVRTMLRKWPAAQFLNLFHIDGLGSCSSASAPLWFLSRGVFSPVELLFDMSGGRGQTSRACPVDRDEIVQVKGRSSRRINRYWLHPQTKYEQKNDLVWGRYLLSCYRDPLMDHATS